MGLDKNTTKVSSNEGNSIPDAMTDGKIIEIKDSKTVTNTKQIRIQKELPQKQDKQHIIVISKNTHVTENAAKRSVVKRRNDLGPKEPENK